METAAFLIPVVTRDALSPALALGEAGVSFEGYTYEDGAMLVVVADGLQQDAAQALQDAGYELGETIPGRILSVEHVAGGLAKALQPYAGLYELSFTIMEDRVVIA